MLFVDCLDGVGYLMLALLVWGGGLSCGLILPLVDQEGVSLAVCWRAPYATLSTLLDRLGGID